MGSQEYKVSSTSENQLMYYVISIKLKNKNYMIISIDVEKHWTKSNTLS